MQVSAGGQRHLANAPRGCSAGLAVPSLEHLTRRVYEVRGVEGTRNAYDADVDAVHSEHLGFEEGQRIEDVVQDVAKPVSGVRRAFRRPAEQRSVVVDSEQQPPSSRVGEGGYDSRERRAVGLTLSFQGVALGCVEELAQNAGILQVRDA